MSDAIEIENYNKSVARYHDDWGKEAVAAAKELAPVMVEIGKLAANKSPSPDEKKQLKKLREKCKALHDPMEAASQDVDHNLILVSASPKAPEEGVSLTIEDECKADAEE